MTQEVIVYRNPFEADLWHALYNGDLLPMIAGIVLAAIVLLSVYGAVVFIGGYVERFMNHRSLKSGKGTLAWKTRRKLAQVFSAFGLIVGLVVVCVAAKLI